MSYIKITTKVTIDIDGIYCGVDCNGISPDFGGKCRYLCIFHNNAILKETEKESGKFFRCKKCLEAKGAK